MGIAFTVIPYNTGLTLRPPSRAEASERLTILLTSPLFIQPRSTPSVPTGMRAHFQKKRSNGFIDDSTVKISKQASTGVPKWWVESPHPIAYNCRALITRKRITQSLINHSSISFDTFCAPPSCTPTSVWGCYWAGTIPFPLLS